MTFDQKTAWASRLGFRQLVWLFPLAYALHVLEELPRFAAWAIRYANPGFTMRDYLTIHLTGIAVAVAAPLAIRYSSNRLVIFAFLTFVFTPAAFFNIVFHAGATVVFGAYCPGLITALTIYPVVFFLVSRSALRERLLPVSLAVVSGYPVYFTWRMFLTMFLERGSPKSSPVVRLDVLFTTNVQWGFQFFVSRKEAQKTRENRQSVCAFVA